MNFIKNITTLIGSLLVILSFSCSKKDVPVNNDDLKGFQLASTILSDKHKIELYTTNGKFQTGYNTIYFQIKDADGTLIKNASATWTPVMHMTSMSHSCPASAISTKENTSTVYGGFVVFQMAGNDAEYWELSINYTLNGISYTAKAKINVEAAPKRIVESFVGSDNNRYILALAEPTAPRVAVNDMVAVVYKMQSMMSFVPVDGFTVKIDPRMPGMGNHGSPNNVDLVKGTDGLYHGKLSLTMTGYWKINLQLLDASQNLLKGEPVTTNNESSSIYFELEF